MRTFVFDARTATVHFPGIGRYVAGLLPALAAQLSAQERLVVLCTDAAQAAPFAPLWASSTAVSTYHTQLDAFAPAQQWRIPRILRSLAARTDSLVYHSPYYLMPYWTGARAVLTVHDLIPLLLPETVSPRARLFFRLTHGLALRSARQVIAVSAATASDLSKHYGIEQRRIAIIPHGVELRFRPQSSLEIARVRARYSLPESFNLYVGINKPHKNLVNLVEAYTLLPDETPPLVIAGAWDPRYPEVKEAVAQRSLSERVRFLGVVEDADLPGLYSAATIFVFPSCYEGFGFPVLEAMACGTPVICSQISSLPEVAGGAAAYFDPSQPADIARALSTLIADSARQKMLAGMGLARSATFTWERAAARTLLSYRELAT